VVAVLANITNNRLVDLGSPSYTRLDHRPKLHGSQWEPSKVLIHVAVLENSGWLETCGRNVLQTHTQYLDDELTWRLNVQYFFPS